MVMEGSCKDGNNNHNIVFYNQILPFFIYTQISVGKGVTLKATSQVNSGQMLLAATELREFRRIWNPSKLKCFTFAHNSELKFG